MRRSGEIRIVPNWVDEALAMARDFIGMVLCVGVLLAVTILAGRWM